MSRRVEAHIDVAKPDLFAVSDRLRAAGEFLAVAQPHDVDRLLCCQDSAVAGTGMVGMAVGDQCSLYGPHRIDVEAADLAAQPGGTRHQDVLRAHFCHIGSNVAASSPFHLPVPAMPSPLFLSSGDLIADRRFEFARDLQVEGDLIAAAELLDQTVELAPNFTSAWFALGEIRWELRERDAAIAAIRQARASDPADRHGAAVRLMQLGAVPLTAM